MAETFARQPVLPWTLRLFEAAPVSPLWVGAAIAAVYLLVWVAWFELFAHAGGPRSLWGVSGWSETLVRALILGYTPALVWIGREGAARDLRDLRPALDGSDGQFAAVQAGVLAIDRRALRIAGLLGCAVLAGLLYSTDPFGLLGRSRETPAVILWDAAWMAALGWLLFRALAHDLRMARAFSRIGESAARLDLLDMRPLAPLTRWGLRTVLLWAVWFAILALFWVSPEATPGNALGLVPLLVVAVAALLLPVVMDISRQTRRPPSKLLIPLAFSSLLGGLMTLIGTPPNILVSAAMEEHGLGPFQMFDFAPVGAVVVAAGIVYMVLVGRRILPARNAAREMAGEDVDLDEVYSLRDRLFVLDVPAGSPLAGKSLAECRVGSALGLNVMGIRHGGRLNLAPDPAIRFEPGDQVVVQGQRDALGEVGAPKYLSLEPTRVSSQDLLSTDVGFAELVLRRRSRFVGRTLRDIDFRNRFNVLIVALWRDGQALTADLASAE
ncbi:MAG: SLC13 family permease, partial [Myxococcota bacterium]